MCLIGKFINVYGCDNKSKGLMSNSWMQRICYINLVVINGP